MSTNGVMSLKANDDASISQLNQVQIYDLLETYPTDSDIVCKYSVNHGFEYSDGDRIGIFEVGWQSFADDALFVQKAPPPSEAIILKAEHLPKDEKVYQLCYITSQDKIAGASCPFFFQPPTENELVAVEDSAHDFMTVKSNFALIQTQNGQLTVQNEKLIKENVKLTQELDRLKTALASIKEPKQCPTAKNSNMSSQTISTPSTDSSKVSGNENYILEPESVYKDLYIKTREKCEKLGRELADYKYNRVDFRLPVPVFTIEETPDNRMDRLLMENEGLREYIKQLEVSTVSKSGVNESYSALKPTSADQQMDQIMHALSDELARVESENQFLKEELDRIRMISMSALAKEREKHALECKLLKDEFELFLGLKMDVEDGKYPDEDDMQLHLATLSKRFPMKSSKYIFSALIYRWSKGKMSYAKCLELAKIHPGSSDSTLNGTCESYFQSFAGRITKDGVATTATNDVQTRKGELSNGGEAEENVKNPYSLSAANKNSSNNLKAFMDVFEIPDIFLEAAKIALNDPKFDPISSKKSLFTHQRKIMCDIPYMKAPVNVILGQQVTENTTFDLHIQTLSEFKNLTIKLMNDIAKIPFQLHASSNSDEGVILNSLDGTWGSEEKHTELTLKANCAYFVVISVKKEEFVVTFFKVPNRSELVSLKFLHRMPPTEVRYVNISGNVVMNECWVTEPEKTCCQKRHEKYHLAFLEYLSLSRTSLALRRKLSKIKEVISLEDKFEDDDILKGFFENQAVDES